MSELELLEEEKVIFETNVLRYYSILASKTHVILTNKRLILLPKNRWEKKIFAKPATVELSSIEGIQTEKINQIFSIEHKMGNIRVSGSSVPLLIGQLNRTKEPSAATLKIQQYQAEVSISRGMGLSTAGLVIVQDGHILLHTYPGVKGMFLPSVNYDVFIPDVIEHKYLQIGSKLSIKTQNEDLSFLGFGAFVCNIILNLHKNNEDLLGTIHHAALVKDNLRIDGALFVCSENVYFVPQKGFHRNFDKPYLRISLSKIHFIELSTKGDENLIILSSEEKKWTLSIQNAKFNYGILVQDITKVLDAKTIKKKVRVETLLKTRVQFLHENKIVFGYIFITKEDVCFTPETGSALALRIPLNDITQKTQLNHSLQLHTKEKVFGFRSSYKENLVRILDTIENINPPEHLLSPSGNCSLQEVSGNSWSAKLSEPNNEVETSFLKVQVKNNQVRLLLSHLPKEVDFKRGQKLSIDLARQHSRFCFQTRVLAFSRESKTPIINAIITVEKPSNIFRHSLRNNFRVPIVQETKIKNVWKDKESILEEVTLSKEPLRCVMTNISAGGCQLAFPYSISKKKNIQNMEIECTVTMEEKEFTVKGSCVYTTVNPRNPKEQIYGLKFDGLEEECKITLERNIQQFEQLQSQKNTSNEEGEDSSSSLNPMLHSAMILTKIPAFSNLTLSEAAQLLASGENHVFTKGKKLIQEGETGDSFFVLTSGSADVYKGTEKIATLEKGSAIGELSLIDPAPRNATIQAKTDGSWVEITKADFEISISQGNQIYIKVLQSLSETVLERLLRIRQATQDEIDKGKNGSIKRILEDKSSTNDD